MKTKWVIIRIEIKSREFLSKLFIVYSLLKKGYGVIITNKLGLDVNMFPVGIYMINSLFVSTRKNIIRLKKKGQKIVFLDEEGLVYQNDKACLSRVDGESMKFLDQIYCNGKDQYRIMVSAFPELSEKIFITGNPRLNLLNLSNVGLVSDEVEGIKKKYGDFILIVSTFAFVNHNDALSDSDERRKYMKSVLKYVGEEEREYFEEQFEYDSKQFSAMKELIEEIHYCIGYKIIIRPHPSESFEGWNNFAKNIDGVDVIREGPLLSWILASKLVLENNCTSAIESMYLHVPCISFRPFKDERFDQPLPNMLSKNVETIEEALTEIRSVLNDASYYQFDKYEVIASEYVSYQNEMDSVDEIVKRMESLRVEDAVYSLSLAKLYKMNPKRLPYVLKEWIKKVLIYIPDSFVNFFPEAFKTKILILKQDISKQKYGDIDAEDVKKILKKIAEIRNEKIFNYSVEQLGEEIIIMPEKKQARIKM